MNNEDVLIESETVFNRSKLEKKNKQSIYDFVVVLNKKEIAQIKKGIHENGEKVHEEYWN